MGGNIDKPASSPSSDILRLVKLNANSFTLNVGGDQKHFDREQHDHFDVSISAWDLLSSQPRTIYTFTIRLVDINDNAPRFEKASYEFDVLENNDDLMVGQVHAHDADADEINSNLTYSIKEKQMNEIFQIDAQTGSIRSLVKFDREAAEKYTFHVIAADSHNHPTAALHSSTLVTVHIRDVNDNPPSISFNSTHYHRFHQINQRISSAYFRLGDSLPVGSRLVDFRASDRDLGSKFEFGFDLTITATGLNSGGSTAAAAATAAATTTAVNSMFRLTPGGQLYLAKRLDKKKQSIHELNIVCKDAPGSIDSLNATIKLTIEVVDEIEPCIKGPERY